MAGQLKEVRNRIKSVQSTQQITKAMKMVSAAKVRRAQDAIQQMRPYAKKLQEMLSNIVSNTEVEGGNTLASERPVEKVLFLVITSDRGLAGAATGRAGAEDEAGEEEQGDREGATHERDLVSRGRRPRSVNDRVRVAGCARPRRRCSPGGRIRRAG